MRRVFGDEEVERLRARVLLATSILDFLADEVLAQILVRRNVEIARARVVCGWRPVLAAPERRAINSGFPDGGLALHVVFGPARHGIDAREHVLLDVRPGANERDSRSLALEQPEVAAAAGVHEAGNGATVAL